MSRTRHELYGFLRRAVREPDVRESSEPPFLLDCRFTPLWGSAAWCGLDVQQGRVERDASVACGDQMSCRELPLCSERSVRYSLYYPSRAQAVLGTIAVRCSTCRSLVTLMWPRTTSIVRSWEMGEELSLCTTEVFLLSGSAPKPQSTTSGCSPHAPLSINSLGQGLAFRRFLSESRRFFCLSSPPPRYVQIASQEDRMLGTCFLFLA